MEARVHAGTRVAGEDSRAVRRQSGAKVCSTSGQARCARARARKRTGPLEFGDRVPPKFDQQFDPFGESIYNASDYWEASFYNEPDETPVEVYVDNLKKSDAIAKLKEGARRITQVSPSGLEKALSSATGSLQVVLVRLPFCKGSEELRPGLEELAQESSGADFFEVILKDSRGDSGDLLGDVWLSPTVKAFKDGQQVAQAEEPAVEDVQRILRS